MPSRRRVLRELIAAGGAASLAACLERDEDSTETVPRGDPSNRPARQHAWNDRLRTDGDGNYLPPRHHVYLYLDYAGDDVEADCHAVETSLRALESAFEATHAGLLFTLGYSASYFEAHGDDVPVPPPEPIVLGENVALDDQDALLHLASDAADVVLEAEEALFDGRDTANGVTVEGLSEVFSVERRRTGFFGFGAPAERRHLNGLPADSESANPVPDDAPFFTGFRSGFRRNQATEDRVTIEEGRFAGGTTQHLAIVSLNLTNWFDLDGDTQVAKLFGPGQSFEDVGPIGSALTDHNGVDDATDEDLLASARTEGVVGHAQKLARLREDGRPLILRRDVNSDDLGEAGVVFLSLQRSVADFVRLRRAMEGDVVAGEGDVGPVRNNGILTYLSTRRRGTFLVPPREQRALPE